MSSKKASPATPPTTPPTTVEVIGPGSDPPLETDVDVDEDDEVADEKAVVCEPKPAAPVPPEDDPGFAPLYAVPVVLAGMELDEAGVAEVNVE